MNDPRKPEDRSGPGNRLKFVAGGLLITVAVVYLIATSTRAAAQYYLTIDELHAKGAAIQGRSLRVSGAVIGESILYDVPSLTLRFTIVNVPADAKQIEAAGGFGQILRDAVKDPDAKRLQVVYVGPMPDLLRHEAQAIVTGQLGGDGIFYADELLLKCPTRYEDEVPMQVQEG